MPVLWLNSLVLDLSGSKHHTASIHLIWTTLSIGASLVPQMVKNLPAMQEMLVPSLGWEDPLKKEMALQYSCLENPMDRGAWQPTAHRVAQSRTRLKQLSMNTLRAIEVLWNFNSGRLWVSGEYLQNSNFFHNVSTKTRLNISATDLNEMFSFSALYIFVCSFPINSTTGLKISIQIYQHQRKYVFSEFSIMTKTSQANLKLNSPWS